MAELLAAFLRVAPRDRLTLLRTSLMPEWSRIVAETHEDLIAHVANDKLFRVRHLFSLHLADQVDAPETFFVYREVDEARGSAGYVQLGLPPETPPSVLFELAQIAAQRVPMWCGSGGYLGSGHPAELPTSHAVFYMWAKRYWGLDVQDPDRARLHAHEGLPSVNWLTLLGRDLLEPTDLLKLERSAARRASIQWSQHDEAVVLRTGEAPTLADTHLLQTESALGDAHALLAPLSLREPVRLYANFSDGDGARRWSRRFLEPEGWA